MHVFSIPCLSLVLYKICYSLSQSGTKHLMYSSVHTGIKKTFQTFLKSLNLLNSSGFEPLYHESCSGKWNLSRPAPFSSWFYSRHKGWHHTVYIWFRFKLFLLLSLLLTDPFFSPQFNKIDRKCNFYTFCSRFCHSLIVNTQLDKGDTFILDMLPKKLDSSGK